jgi:hypothetical protein
MSDDIDSRGRDAAAALRRAVPDADATAAPARRSPRAPFLVAAAGIVVALALAATLFASDGDDDDAVRAGVGSLAPRVVRDLPAGMELAGGFDLPVDSLADEATPLWLYGSGDRGDPFADGDAAITRQVEDLPLDDLAADRVEIGDHAGVIDQLDRQTRLRVQVDDEVVSVLTWSLDRDGLVALGTELLADGLPGEAPTELAGMRLIGQVNATGGVAAPVLEGARGHAVTYQSDDDDGRGLMVTVVDDVPRGWEVVLWALGPDAASLEVDGNEARVASPFAETSSVIAWRDDGLIILVSGFGLDRAAVIAAAESLEVATEDEWAAAKAKVLEPGEVELPDDAVIGIGPHEVDGSLVLAYLKEDGSLCADVASASSGSGTCSAAPVDGPVPRAPVVAAAKDNGGTTIAVFGLAPGGTTDVRGGEGWELVDLTPIGLPDGDQLFLVVGIAEPVPPEVIFVRADGTEIARAALDG